MGEIADYYIEEAIASQLDYDFWDERRDEATVRVYALSDIELIEAILQEPKELLNKEKFPAWDVANKLKLCHPLPMTSKQRTALRNTLIYHYT